ncbi:MAG: hypothetical protein J6X33_04475 [Clostridiales bacterium]|nr:hypothetical protein [Clostridiales bacterium]
MHEFISTILNMSLTGSIVILVVLAARFLMRKLPKKYLYLLWGIVGLRLLCPVALESDLSIFNIAPLKESVNTVKDLPIADYKEVVEASHRSTATVDRAVTAATSGSFNTSYVIIALWAAVALGIAIYITRQYFLLRKNLKNVTELEPGLCVGAQIDSPFVMGLLKPTIYMPQGLADDEMRYLLLHEKTHIRRRDTIFKAIGLLAVALHWFNPLVWLAYKLFVQDMEMSCDEEVISELGVNAKADYSMSLVSFASRNHQPKYIVVPVTFSKTVFGGKEVKMRIQNILSYKGTSKLIATVSLVLVAAIGLVCLFNANTHADQPADGQQATAATTVADDDEQALLDQLAAAAAADADADDQDDKNDIQSVDADDNDDAAAAVDTNDEEPAVATDPADVADDADDADDKADTSASDTELSYVTPDGFGIKLPIVNTERIFNIVDLGKGKHTPKKNPELAYSLAPDDSFTGKVFEARADKKVSDSLFEQNVKALEDMGFEEFLNEVDGTYYGFNKDLKIGVVIENIPGIYRISYFEMSSTSDWNPFLALG